MKSLLGRGKQSKELHEELQSHLEMAERDAIERGRSPREAREAAVRELGNVGLIKEVTREVWGWTSLERLMQDLRFGARLLGRNPGFTLIAILTLALGIGANTAIFSMVNWILLRPLPVKDPQQIYVLGFQQDKSQIQNQFSVIEYKDIRSQSNEVFSDVITYGIGLDGIVVNKKSDRIMTSYVSGNFFSALGLRPTVGRLLLPSEGETQDADPVIVLTYSYWVAHFGADPGIVGQKVSINGHPLTVVGVGPKDFDGIHPFLSFQAFLPLGMAGMEGYPPDYMTNRALKQVQVYGRLRPDMTMEQANSTLAVLADRMAKTNPIEEKGFSLAAYPELRSRPNPATNNPIPLVSGLFLALAVLVLLLACGNVANILLVRASVREREMAVRLALGAARSRLVRQLLTESILLAVAGGLAGLLLGGWGSSMIGSLPLQVAIPIRFNFGIDWRVFSYALGAALLTGIIVGLVPAIRASRGNLSTILHEGGRTATGGRNRIRTALVIAQVGGSLMLLIVAGLFMRSLAAVQRTDLGFNPNHLLNATMDPNEIGYSETQGREFYRNLLEKARALPSVESASVALSVPLGYYSNGDTLTIEGYQTPPGQPPPNSAYNLVAGDYFKTLEIPLLSGRAFTPADNENAPYVAIVSETLVGTYWKDKNPLGLHVTLAGEPKHPMEIVGVAKDVRFQGVTGPFAPYLYLPLAQHFSGNTLQTLQLRVAGDPVSMIPVVQQTINGLEPELPVFDVRTMNEALDTLNGYLFYKIGAGLAAVFGVLGLTLTIVGVYGVISFAASQRTHEIGIRMALGAQQADILKMVFRQGVIIISIGLVIGIGLALGAAKVVGNFLAVSATDPATYICVCLLLAIIGLLACYIPARRAMRTDPIVALRYE